MVRNKPQILWGCKNCGVTKVATKRPKCSKCGNKMIARPPITGS